MKLLVLLQWRHNACDGVSNHRPSIVCSAVCSGADQRKHQSRVTALSEGNPPVTGGSPHSGEVTRIDDVIMVLQKKPPCEIDVNKTYISYENAVFVSFVTIEAWSHKVRYNLIAHMLYVFYNPIDLHACAKNTYHKTYFSLVILILF